MVDSFDVSYGDPQTVAVTARRDQRQRRLNYRVNGGRTQRAPVDEWEGGERYGDERDVYYAEYRGEVRGTRTGDSVEVWFTPRGRGGRTVESDHFTYTVAADAGADALIVANEDYTGVNPTYPPGTTGPRHADDYQAALDANGVTHVTWDVDAQGVPHPLGVLAHFGAVVSESGDDRLPQAPEDRFTNTFLFGPLPDIAVAERQQFLTLAVRDYLNEGGKLVQAGETSQYQGVIGRSLGGIYYGLDGAIDRPARSPATSSPTAGSSPTTSPSTTWAPGSGSRPPGPTGSRAPGRWPACPGPSAARPWPATRSTRPARSRSRATSCRPTGSRCSPARRRAATPAPPRPTRSARWRATGTPPPCTPTRPISASAAPSTSPAWRPPTPRRCG